MVAPALGSRDARTQFRAIVFAENGQASHQATEFFHRFPIFARQIAVHDPKLKQYRIRF